MNKKYFLINALWRSGCCTNNFARRFITKKMALNIENNVTSHS